MDGGGRGRRSGAGEQPHAPRRGTATAGARDRPCRKSAPWRPRYARIRATGPAPDAAASPAPRTQSGAPPAKNAGSGRIAPAGKPRRLSDRRVEPPRRRRVVGVDRPEPHQQRGDGAFRGAGGAVLDLQRDAEAALGQDRHEDRLGAGLDRHAAPIAAISSEQARPSPATSSGCASIAATSRRAAASRAGPRPRGSAIRAIAQASPCTVVAKFGAEQPSMPQPGLSAPHISSKAARTARCTGWSISTYSGPPPSRRFSVEEPRVLARAVVVQLAGRLARRAQPVPLRRRRRAPAGRSAGRPRRDPELGQPARHPLDVHRRALVRGAGERQLLGAEARRRRRSRPAAAPAASCRTTAAGSPPRGRPRRRRSRRWRRRSPRGRGGAIRRRSPRQTSTMRHRVSHRRTPPPDPRPVSHAGGGTRAGSAT